MMKFTTTLAACMALFLFSGVAMAAEGSMTDGGQAWITSLLVWLLEWQPSVAVLAKVVLRAPHWKAWRATPKHRVIFGPR